MQMLAAQKPLVRRIAAVVAGVLVLALVFYAGYWYSLDSVKVRYETAFVEYADIVRTVIRAGTVVPAAEQTIRAGASGTVKSLLVKAGDRVSAGQTLMLLDNPQAEVSGRQAEVAAEMARLAFADVFDQAVATRVYAPVGGRVASLTARPGDKVTRGAVAAVIHDPDRMEVTVQVPEYVRAGLTVGQPAAVTAAVLPGGTLEGKVAEVGGTLHGAPGEATVDVVVEFAAGGKVPPGSTVTVSVTAAAARMPCEGSVVLPAEGVYVARDKSTVSAAIVSEGERVKSGDLLLQLANPTLVAQRDQARIAYTQANTRYESIRYRYTEGDPILETIRLQMVQAKLNWEDLDARVSALTIKAPYDGTAIGLAGGAGTEIAAGQLVCQVVPAAWFMVEAAAPLAQLAWVESGDAVIVDVPAANQADLRGQVVSKAMPVGTAATAGLLVRVDGVQQPWPGTAARVFLPAKTEQVAARGACEASAAEEVLFGASGTVITVFPQEGEIVNAGARLYTLRNPELLAEGQYPDDTTLPDVPSALLPIAGPVLREAILAVEAGTLAAQQRMSERASLTVRAVGAGTVTSVLVDEGSAVGQGTALAKVADPGALEVLADVGQADVNRLQPGAEIEVLFPSLSSTPVMAQLVSVDQTAQNTGDGPAYPIRLQLPAVPGLRSGMSCVVDMVTDVRPQVPSVPVEAVQERYGSQAVRVIVDPAKAAGAGSLVRESRTWKGEVEWVYVVTGLSDGVRVEILKGIQPGTEIVLREIER